MTVNFDAQRVIAAVLLAATALFLMSQWPGGRHRRAAMIAAIAIYGVLVAGVVVYVGLWAVGVMR